MMHRYHAAFTLVELVIVIALLAILSVNVLPNLAQDTTFKSRYFLDKSIGMLRHAQQLAFTTGCGVQVSATASTMTMYFRDGCTTGNYSTLVPAPWLSVEGASGFAIEAPSGVSIGFTNSLTTFNARGQAIDAATGLVQDNQITLGGRTINIVGQTGFAYAQ